MNELELSSLKYPVLEKLGNLANKAQNTEKGIEQFIKILPTFEAKTNEIMQIKNVDNVNEGKKVNKFKEDLKQNENQTVLASATPSFSKNRPFFTGNGKAEQAVRNMQKIASKARSSQQNEGYER